MAEFEPKAPFPEFFFNHEKNNGNGEHKKEDQAREDINQTINLFTQYIESNPDNPEGYFYRGLLYVSINKLDQAIQDFSQTINLNEKHFRAYLMRGATWQDIAEQYDQQDEGPKSLYAYQKAISDYTDAIRLNESCFEAYYYRGTVYGRLGKLKNAESDFRKALEIKKDYPDAYFGLGMVYIEKSQRISKEEKKIAFIKKAIYYFEQSLSLNPQHSLSNLFCGCAYFELGENQEALNYLNKAIELDSNEPYAYFFRALVYERMGKKDLAQKDLEKSEELEEKRKRKKK